VRLTLDLGLPGIEPGPLDDLSVQSLLTSAPFFYLMSGRLDKYFRNLDLYPGSRPRAIRAPP